MDISFYGADCVAVTTKQARFVIDDNLAELGGTSAIKAGDVVLFTTADYVPPKIETKLTIAGPGEYEIGDVSVRGIAARAHVDESDGLSATMYKVIADDVRVLVIGHVYPALSEAQLEQIGTIDVLLVPVGGNGYTLDGVGALSLIKKIEPKLVIPTHYADKNLKFEVPQQSLEEALKNLAMEPKETVAKLRVKPGELADTATQVVVLERQ